jgi:putative nucleotidyltransferase with HDIG domain
MSTLPWTARLYISLVTALAIGAVLLSALTLENDAGLWPVALVFAVVIAVLDAIPIGLYGEQVEITISDSIKFAAVLLYPAPVAILGIFIGTLLGEVPAKRGWFKKVFNISAMTLTWSVVACFYLVLRQPQIDFFGSLQNIFALIVSGLAGFGINSVLVSLVIGLAAHLPFRYVWSRNYRQVIWHDLSMVPLGAFLAVLWRFNPISVVLAGLPLLVVRDAYKTANELQRQTFDALRALVRVIDERDQHTFDHSERVSNYARMIASALDLPQEEIEVIAPAALLHDLGKVGMADDILFNPKRLDLDERKSAEQHAEIGGELLSRFPLFEKGAVLVRHHHERYDGTGYPDGLKGETIPIGARIISIADAYQAMTEERPYRPALSQREAIARLIEGSGSQFDPRVVQAFLTVLSSATPPEQTTIAAVPAVEVSSR